MTCSEDLSDNSFAEDFINFFGLNNESIDLHSDLEQGKVVGVPSDVKIPSMEEAMSIPPYFAAVGLTLVPIYNPPC